MVPVSLKTKDCQIVKFLYDCHRQNDERPFLTDVDIICAGGIIPVHSIVLTAGSPILREYINGLSSRERERIIIHFIDHDVRHVLLVIQALYTGQCIVPNKNDLNRVLDALDNLGVPRDKFQRCWATPEDLKQVCKLRQYLYDDDDDENDLIDDEQEETVSPSASSSNRDKDENKTQVQPLLSHGANNNNNDNSVQKAPTDKNTQIEVTVQDKKDDAVPNNLIITKEIQAVDRTQPVGTEDMEIDRQVTEEEEEEENITENSEPHNGVRNLSKRKKKWRPSQKSRKREKSECSSSPPPVPATSSSDSSVSTSSSEEQSSDDANGGRHTRTKFSNQKLSRFILKRRQYQHRRRKSASTIKQEKEEEDDEEEQEARARILATSDTETDRTICCPICKFDVLQKYFECHITSSKCFKSISKKCRLKQRECHSCRRRHSRKSLEEFVNHVIECMPEREEEEEEEASEEEEEEANEEEEEEANEEEEEEATEEEVEEENEGEVEAATEEEVEEANEGEVEEANAGEVEEANEEEVEEANEEAESNEVEGEIEESDDDDESSLTLTSDDEWIEPGEKTSLRQPVIVLNRITPEQFEKYWAKKYRMDEGRDIPTSISSNKISSTSNSTSTPTPTSCSNKSSTSSSRPITTTTTTTAASTSKNSSSVSTATSLSPIMTATTTSTLIGNNNPPAKPSEVKDTISIAPIRSQIAKHVENVVTVTNNSDATTTTPSAENSTAAAQPPVTSIRREPEMVEPMEQESVSQNEIQVRNLNSTAAATTTNLISSATIKSKATSTGGTTTKSNLASATTTTIVHPNVTSPLTTTTTTIVGHSTSTNNSGNSLSLPEPSPVPSHVQNSPIINISHDVNPTTTTAIPNDTSLGRSTVIQSVVNQQTSSNIVRSPPQKIKKKIPPLPLPPDRKNKIATVMKSVFDKLNLTPNPRLVVPSSSPLNLKKSTPPAATVPDIVTTSNISSSRPPPAKIYPTPVAQPRNLPSPIRRPPPHTSAAPQSSSMATGPETTTGTSQKQRIILPSSPGQSRTVTSPVRRPLNVTMSTSPGQTPAAAAMQSSPGQPTGSSTTPKPYAGVLQLYRQRLATSKPPEQQRGVNGVSTASSMIQKDVTTSNNSVTSKPSLDRHTTVNGVSGQVQQQQQPVERTPQVMPSRTESNGNPCPLARPGLSREFVAATPVILQQQQITQISMIQVSQIAMVPPILTTTTTLSLPPTSNYIHQVPPHPQMDNNDLIPNFDSGSGTGLYVNGVILCEKCEQQFSTQISFQDHFCLESD